MKTIKAADLFCGAGGSSTGLKRVADALGVALDLTAVNHWPIAVETHAANHPGARHVCKSIDDIDPRKVTGGSLDLLWASPECTHHSTARGGKPINDQSRSTAWCVTRWAEALRPKFIIVENVPEFQTWGPIGSTNRPLQSRKGETFAAWVGTLTSLGYTVEARVLNSADYGAATTRRRLFVVARFDGGARGRGSIAWPATHPWTREPRSPAAAAMESRSRDHRLE
jgi:DNA (cytosine-5)-methyltransferase 1